MGNIAVAVSVVGSVTLASEQLIWHVLQPLLSVPAVVVSEEPQETVGSESVKLACVQAIAETSNAVIVMWLLPVILTVDASGMIALLYCVLPVVPLPGREHVK